MQYKVGLEIAAAFFLAVLYVFLWVQYGKGSQVNRKFRMLTLCVLAANVLDVVTACTISYSAAVPQLLNLLLNTAYLVVDALAGILFSVLRLCLYLSWAGKRARIVDKPCVYMDLYCYTGAESVYGTLHIL